MLGMAGADVSEAVNNVLGGENAARGDKIDEQRFEMFCHFMPSSRATTSSGLLRPSWIRSGLAPQVQYRWLRSGLLECFGLTHRAAEEGDPGGPACP